MIPTSTNVQVRTSEQVPAQAAAVAVMMVEGAAVSQGTVKQLGSDLRQGLSRLGQAGIAKGKARDVVADLVGNDINPVTLAAVVQRAGRDAHPLQGAAFLSFFVTSDAGIPWAHLDIAGVADTDRDLPLYSKGATGWGVRTLVRWLEDGG